MSVFLGATPVVLLHGVIVTVTGSFYMYSIVKQVYMWYRYLYPRDRYDCLYNFVSNNGN